MGYFTWTFADKPKKKLGYGQAGYVVQPDDTIIEEKYYDGYGNFGGHDVYDLVVDWNFEYLDAVLDRIEADEKHFGVGDCRYTFDTARLYAKGGEDAVKEFVEYVASKIGSYWKSDWKRNIGIMIACEDEDNKALPYPIKIASTDKLDIRYEDLFPSYSTQ